MTPKDLPMLVEALRTAVRQNSHDMLMTGEELRACEAALEAYELGARSTAAQPVEPTGLRSAALALIAKMDVLKPHMDALCLDSHNRGRPYKGPTYGIELEALRAAASGDSTPPSEPAGLTDDRIKRHTLRAADCPPDSKVLLVSSVRRFLAAQGDPSGALQPDPEAADHDRAAATRAAPVDIIARLRDWADETYALQDGELPAVRSDLAAAATEIEALRVCLDWLDQAAREPGGILLHAEMNTGRLGLGLGPNCGNRHLREAIRYARGSELPQTASGCSHTARSDGTRSQKLADAGFTRRPSLWALQAREALELIAAPQRADGSWNRDREACRQLAAEALGRDTDSDVQNGVGQPEAPTAAPLDVACHECTECGHIGINDESGTESACSMCRWHGLSPDKDVCPECSEEGTMCSACPKCGGYYTTLAETRIAHPPARSGAGSDVDQLRALLDEVRRAFTRDDDLPDGLLGRIDAALADPK